MAAQSIENFLRLLKEAPSGAVFNPWWQVDEENDIGSHAPRIRLTQLRAYLLARLKKARLAVIGEAIGYRGGHFSGIAMTSERILLGRNRIARIEPQQLLLRITPQRTSKPRKCADGFSEPTATIVWSSLLRLGLSPLEFVLWNGFPWHSFNPHRGMLSNRMPSKTERSAGASVLQAFLDLFPCREVVALGRIAASQLQDLGIDAHYIRHPASGGGKLFRQQIAKIVAGWPSELASQPNVTASIVQYRKLNPALKF
jgi:hypothetical protein